MIVQTTDKYLQNCKNFFDEKKKKRLFKLSQTKNITMQQQNNSNYVTLSFSSKFKKEMKNKVKLETKQEARTAALTPLRAKFENLKNDKETSKNSLRQQAWKLVKEAAAILKRSPTAKWPSGCLEDYLKDLESFFSVVAIAPSGNSTTEKKIPSSPVFDPFEIDMEPAPFSIVDEATCKKEQEAKNEFENESDNFSTPVQTPKREEIPELNDVISPTRISPPRHNCHRNFNYASKQEKQSEFYTEVKIFDLDSPKQQKDYKNPEWELWNGFVESQQQLGLSPTSPPSVYPFHWLNIYRNWEVQNKGKAPLDISPLEKQVFQENRYLNYRQQKRKQTKYNRYSKKYQQWVMRAEARKRWEQDPKNEKPEGGSAVAIELQVDIPVLDKKEICVIEKEKEETAIIKPTIQEKVVSLLKSLPPPAICLYGGVKEAVPPHLRSTHITQQRIDPTTRNTSIVTPATQNYFERNFTYRPGRRGLGVGEHTFVIDPLVYLAVSPVVKNFAGRLAKIAMQKAIEKQHGSVKAGIFPKLQFVFSNPQTQQYRRTKCVDTKNVADLGGAFFDELGVWGSDPLEDFGGSLHSIRVLVPQNYARGGCDSRAHTHSFSTYKILTLKSNNNNCGVACLTYGLDREGEQYNTIRRACNIAVGSKLEFTDMEYIATYLNVGFRIWKMEGAVLDVAHSFQIEKEKIQDIIYNPVTEHYAILIFKNDKKQCTLCGKYLRNMENHKCAARVVNFYTHFHKHYNTPICMFKEIKETKRSLNDIFVFDLETFPLDGKVHTVYACKMKNLGTGEEWLDYGEGKELLHEILKQSTYGEPVPYIDLNPGFDTGHFQWTDGNGNDHQMHYAEQPTQEEAVTEADKWLLHLMDSEANETAQYYVDQDLKEEKVFLIRKTGGEIIKTWEFGDYNTKPKVEERLRQMKNYRPCVFVAHNLARFDGMFLLNYLVAKGIDCKFCINGGRLISLQWYNSKVWDSCLFIPDSLKNIAKFFKCKVQKGDFDHTLIKTWDDVILYKDVALNQAVGWGPYLDCDVYSLAEIVEKYSQNVYEQFGCDVFNYVTLSSMSYKLWGQTTLETHAVIETPQKETYEFVKDSIYGGRVFPMQKNFATNALNQEEEKEIERIYRSLDDGLKIDDVKYEPQETKEMYRKIYESGSFLYNLDVNSLYPTAMCEEMPVGISEWSKNPKQDFEAGFLGIFHISFVPPKNLIVAILPQRNRPFVSGIEDQKENKRWKGSGIRWSLEPNEGIYTSVDIQLAIEFGYQITFKQKALIWKQKAKVFETYIQKVYKIKKQQDELEGTPEYNPIVRMIAKNTMNSLYGKTCQRPIQDSQTIIRTEEDFYSFMQEYMLNDYVWLKEKGENVLAVSGSPPEIQNTKPSQLGAFVLAYSRKIMTHDFAVSTNNLKLCTFTYTDTDSIHMQGAAYLKMKKEFPHRFGDEMGQLSNDVKGNNAIIIYEICLAPKCYMYVTLDADGVVQVKKKVKGIPKSVMRRLSIEDFEREKEKRLDFDMLKRNVYNKENPLTITNEKAHRTFLKNKWCKMEYNDTTKQFRPFGYSEEEQEITQSLVSLEPFDFSSFNSKEIQETSLKDVWFFKQEPALHLDKERLVKWVTAKPYQPTKQVHYYSRLNVEDICNCLEKNKETSAMLYEVTENFCRLYCDIDLKRSAVLDYEETEFLGDAICCIQEAASHFGLELDMEKLRVTSACTNEKFSFHIVSLEHTFACAGHQKSFWLLCDTIARSSYEKLVLHDQTCFDLGVYHNHRAMRTIYSKKPNKTPLLPIDIFTCKEIEKVNIEEYLCCISKNQFTAVSGLSKEETKEKVQKKHAGCFIVKPKASLPLEIQELLERNKDKLQGFDIKNGETCDKFVRLDRVACGICSSCNRSHERDNGFVYLGKKPFFACYRNKDLRVYLS